MGKKQKKKNTGSDLTVRPVVFCGPRSIISAQVSYIQGVLDELKLNLSITGSAPGIDQFVYGELVKRFPKAHHIVVVPYGFPAQDSFWVGVEKHPRSELLFMPRPKTTGRHPNLLRNDWMCAKAMSENPDKARLVGFPGSAIEQQRSGTWACIRSARRVGLRTDLYPLADAPGNSDWGMFPGIGTDSSAHFEHGKIVRDSD